MGMKIGINVGNVIAGIIGDHKPQFSLIGDPVNTTARIAANGDVNGITVSDGFYKTIINKSKCFYYFQHKTIQAKGFK